jgi:hypothetical protein
MKLMTTRDTLDNNIYDSRRVNVRDTSDLDESIASYALTTRMENRSLNMAEV